MTKFEDAVKALADQRREHFLTCKPSELIMLALEDLEKVEKLKDIYRVDMGVYHDPEDDGRCAVCFAGSVLAQTMKHAPTVNWHFMTDGPKVADRCMALDSFRSGDIWHGLETLEIEPPLNVRESIRIADYEHDPIDFKSGLRWIAKHLAERGL